MMRSLYADVSPLYQETLAARLAYLRFPDGGETRTRTLLKIAATQAGRLLRAQEGEASLARMKAECEIQLGLLHLIEEELPKAMKQRKT
jgi:hypothetical protein